MIDRSSHAMAVESFVYPSCSVIESATRSGISRRTSCKDVSELKDRIPPCWSFAAAPQCCTDFMKIICWRVQLNRRCITLLSVPLWSSVDIWYSDSGMGGVICEHHCLIRDFFSSEVVHPLHPFQPFNSKATALSCFRLFQEP